MAEDRGFGDGRAGTALPRFTMAFQPIVALSDGAIVGHEALVRGPGGELAQTVLDAVAPHAWPGFDRACRVRAVTLAGRLGLASGLWINTSAGSVEDPDAALAPLLEAASAQGIPPGRITLELVEDGRLFDRRFMRALLAAHRRHGVRTALDGFGRGHAGLGLLFELGPDVVKLDMSLVRGIARDAERRRRLACVVEACRGAFDLIALGVETEAERVVLAELGIGIAQGYLFAAPAFERLVTEAELGVGGLARAA